MNEPVKLTLRNDSKFFTSLNSMQPDRFNAAINAFDDYHRKDPNTEVLEGRTYPKELLYAQRMTDRLNAFAPAAGETVKLAARCQHIGRWEIDRSSYPMDRKGYLQWRNEEKMHHAKIAGSILSDCGYETSAIDKVKKLLLKKELYTDPDSQLLEDVACLVFLEHYADEFAAKHSDEKVIDILRKTLKKMSAAAKDAIAGIGVSPKILSLAKRAAQA